MCVQPTVARDLAAAWDEETLFFGGDEFFEALIARIAAAERSVHLESYIFQGDEIGQKVFLALSDAAARGVQVRIIIDGIGSPTWRSVFGARAQAAGVSFRVFHELPWERLLRGRIPGARRERVWRLFAKLNNRNHRKVCIIDEHEAFVGSVNISGVHSARIKGDAAWRDTAAWVKGKDTVVLARSFDSTWSGRFRRLMKGGSLSRFRAAHSSLVLLNNRSRDRRRNYRSLIARIRRAKKRIFITNAYFVPHRSLLKALAQASLSGVDVRLIVPKRSDIFFIPIVTAALREGMLEAGVKVFEYVPAMLHAKSIVIDDWCVVGSSNLNHRSLLHDLEADVVLVNEESEQKLVSQFYRDMESADPIDHTASGLTWYQMILARVFLLIKFIL